MGKFSDAKEKVFAFYQRVKPGLNKTGEICGKTGGVIAAIGRVLFKLRKVFMAIPVALASYYLANESNARLPEEVGINLLSDGTYAHMVPRNIAVLGPVAITALCILLMLCSRRALYPWLISIFTLVLPILIIITNIFPA